MSTPDLSVLVGPEGRQHHLPGHAQAVHGDHRLELRAALEPGSVVLSVRCPECGRRASRSMALKGRPLAGAIPVATSDLNSLTKAALRTFRTCVPASCRDALAEGIMEG